MEKYLTERITHLKKAEMAYFNDSTDTSIPKTMREIYRRFSNEFHARRQECEFTLKEFLQSESTESVSGSSQESGVSHAVRDRNANDQVAPKELEPVAEALEIRTHPESFYCNDWSNMRWGTIERCLKQCDSCKLQETEG